MLLETLKVTGDVKYFAFGVDPGDLSTLKKGWTGFDYSIEETLSKTDIAMVTSKDCPGYKSVAILGNYLLL